MTLPSHFLSKFSPSARKGLSFSLLGTFLVSTNFVTAKYALQGFDPLTFSLVWCSAATFYTLIIIYFTQQQKQLALSRESLRPIILLGLLTGIGMLLGWKGLAILDPSFVAFLKRFEPVLVILLSFIYFKERLVFGEILAIILITLGGIGSALGRWHVIGEGLIFIVGSSVAFALQLFLAKTRVHNVPPIILVFYRISIATGTIALWAIGEGGLNFNVTSHYWVVTFLGALLGPCLSFLCTFNSYRYWELSRSTIVLMLQPLFALLLAAIFLQQFPTKQELIGGFIILIGSLSFIQQYIFQRNSKRMF